jgi:hypothetical protein
MKLFPVSGGGLWEPGYKNYIVISKGFERESLTPALAQKVHNTPSKRIEGGHDEPDH